MYVLGSRPVKFTAAVARALTRWPTALAAVFVLAIVLLIPGLGSTGFWEPQERQLVDRVAPRDEVAAKRAIDEAKRKAEADKLAEKSGQKPAQPKAPEACPKAAPEDATGRTLQAKAPAFGRDTFGDSDFGRRLPLALMGLLTVLATFGIAARTTGSARAGVLSALVLLSFPLLILQSKMVTSEIGTACGATLIVYGLVALSRLRDSLLGLIEGLVALLALVGGAVLAYHAGGILLGTIVPVGAVAAAYGLGAPAIGTLGLAFLALGKRAIALVAPRYRVGRSLARVAPVSRFTVSEQIVGLVATVGLLVLAGVLADQIFELRPPYPGMVPAGRTTFGKVIAATGCWSDALGGIWKADDDLRSIFDSSFEQIAYGTYPWGILAPIAMAGLLGASPAHRRAGGLALGWAGAAWIADEVFSRKVGFSIWAGFPAMAIAIGAWLDHILTERRATTYERDRDQTITPTVLVGLFVILGILVFGKDLQSFTEKLTSILVGSDQIAYPTASRFLWVPTRAWILILGVILGLAFAIAMIVPRPKLARRAVATMLAMTVVISAFWSFGWYPALAVNLSSKTMFDQFHALKAPGDQLVVMGDLGDAPFTYGGKDFEKIETRDGIVKAIQRPNRVFAIAPATELCTLHREIGGKPYFVLDDRNTRSVLLSNKIDGAEDRNPLVAMITHAEPQNIPQKPKAKIVWDNKIQLLGWSIPKTVGRGSKFEVKLYYKILAPVGSAWTSLMHFDGPARFNGDHKPINDRCPTSTWQPGDYIIDTHTVTAGGTTFPRTNYELWIGFFTGTNPNFKNMTLSEAPGDMRDQNDRVKIMSIALD